MIAYTDRAPTRTKMTPTRTIWYGVGRFPRGTMKYVKNWHFRDEL